MTDKKEEKKDKEETPIPQSETGETKESSVKEEAVSVADTKISQSGTLILQTGETGKAEETKESSAKEEDVKDKKEGGFVSGDKKKAPFRSGGRPGGRRARNPRRGQRERFKPEFAQKVIDISRVTRVVSGGRRFSFRVSIVIGNKNGSVGVGLGKSSDTSSAIEKSVRNAKRNMVSIGRTKTNSIPYQVDAKYGTAKVLIMPAPGRGLVAGSSVRNVLELAGVTDISAKIISRSKNKLNNARVAVKALSEFEKIGVVPTKLGAEQDKKRDSKIKSDEDPNAAKRDGQSKRVEKVEVKTNKKENTETVKKS